MMQHPPESLIKRFAEGELSESLAVDLAMHLDDCPACATQAATLEPLALAFASSDDPVLPDDLMLEILGAVSELQVQPALPPTLPKAMPIGPRAELLAGASLFSVAATLFFLLGDPGLFAADLAVGAHAAATAASIGASSLEAIHGAWPAMLAALAFAGCLVLGSALQPQSYARRSRG
jgi:anti-sigma factor RsiW